MQLYFIAAYQQDAEQYQAKLKLRGVDTTLNQVEQINARFLRQHSQMALCTDEHGLGLCAQGMKMQADWLGERARLLRASIKSELIARACQIGEKPKLIDATGGLGHDALLLAYLGAQVTLLERHPILFTLLEDAYNQAAKTDFFNAFLDRINLIFDDSAHYLTQSVQQAQRADVVYLDPMFPKRDQNKNVQKKQAQVKKQMQVLHLLLPEDGQMDLGENLLPLAKQIAKRVVVKRPRHAVFLNDEPPDHQWQGDACRFDAYFQM